MADILIIDDDQMMCEMLSYSIDSMEHSVKCAYTLKDGLDEAATGSFDLVFLDVRMPDGNGLDMLPIIRESPSEPEVIIITGAGDPDGAELAIKSGAWDYIQKTSSIKAMTLQLIRALQYREEKQTNKPLLALKREGIVGNSPQMRYCFDLLAQAARSDVSVLITGETGTGKELFAQAIHDNSARSNRNFVVVDCTALPETLVESILFGYKKGAFTGASESRDGLIKQADGGTLFLDEIGELPFPLQKSFLRVLQDHRFRPLGSQKEVTSNFRLVAATNRNLNELAQSGQFREDLLFRLQSFNIELPSLRERREDIKDLVLHYIAKFCERYGMGLKGFSPEFFAALTGNHWPGNVRELVNTLERAIAAAYDDHILFPKHLPMKIRIQLARDSISKSEEAPAENGSGETAASPVPFPTYRDLQETDIAEVKKKYCQDLMVVTKGNIKDACRISGLSRGHLYELLKRYNISRPD